MDRYLDSTRQRGGIMVVVAVAAAVGSQRKPQRAASPRLTSRSQTHVGPPPATSLWRTDVTTLGDVSTHTPAPAPTTPTANTRPGPTPTNDRASHEDKPRPPRPHRQLPPRRSKPEGTG
ncbi:hypothetical protein E2C01_041298 [Portunus trituberculatus]|uniref:Uncharacterized protein n=1 Tax=Portunus trituberculatus TaxID=210409 RepID=A0A5B7FQK7_PORTR|nr:hypothetical protein [Portunus trituberculatus]